MQYVNKLQPKYSSVDLTEVELPETEGTGSLHGVMDKEDENVNMLVDVSINLISYSERYRVWISSRRPERRYRFSSLSRARGGGLRSDKQRCPAS